MTRRIDNEGRLYDSQERVTSSRLELLFTYPVKSLAGNVSYSAEVTERGLAHDREWMVVLPDGSFLTQREFPRMALIKPELTDTNLVLTSKQNFPVEVPLDFQGNQIAVSIWKDTGIHAIDQGDQVAEWLSDFLQVSCRLVRMAPDYMRKSGSYSRGENDQVGFADGYPFLLANMASLSDLCDRIEQQGDDVELKLTRFRPNIVISKGKAWEEDHWKTIKIGEVVFDLVKPCLRCEVTQIDPLSGEKTGREPLATLATFRKAKEIGYPELGNKVTFGWNLVQRNLGKLDVGAPIEVLEYR